MKVCVVIPTYNERENVRGLIPQIQRILCKNGFGGFVVVVDDASPDGTGELAAIFLVALLTVSTVGVGYGVSASIYSEHSASRYFTDEEVTSVVEWINGNIHGEATLCSKPVVAAWLEALSRKRFIGFRGLDEALASDTIESTGFRILTPSLLVDEWEPYSTSKAPCISYYDGRRYEPIAYIDDSFVRVRLIKDGREWVEGPYRAVFRAIDGSAILSRK